MRLLSVGRRVDVTSVRFRPVIGIGDVDVERHAQIHDVLHHVFHGSLHFVTTVPLPGAVGAT